MEEKITVNCAFERMPDLNRLRMVFDGTPYWKLYRNDRSMLVVTNPLIAGSSDPFAVVLDNTLTNMEFLWGSFPQPDDRYRVHLPNPFELPHGKVLAMYLLAHRHGALIHSAGFVLNDAFYMLAGASGFGKTTISRLLQAAALTVASDERVVLRMNDGKPFAYGTPWPGDAGIAVNCSLPLKGIFFLNQSQDNRVRPVSPKTAFESMMPLSSVPWYDSEAMGGVLSTLETVIGQVPAYVFDFAPDDRAVEFILNFINRQIHR